MSKELKLKSVVTVLCAVGFIIFWTVILHFHPDQDFRDFLAMSTSMFAVTGWFFTEKMILREHLREAQQKINTEENLFRRVADTFITQEAIDAFLGRGALGVDELIGVGLNIQTQMRDSRDRGAIETYRVKLEQNQKGIDFRTQGWEKDFDLVVETLKRIGSTPLRLKNRLYQQYLTKTPPVTEP